MLFVTPVSIHRGPCNLYVANPYGGSIRSWDPPSAHRFAYVPGLLEQAAAVGFAAQIFFLVLSSIGSLPASATIGTAAAATAAPKRHHFALRHLGHRHLLTLGNGNKDFELFG